MPRPPKPPGAVREPITVRITPAERLIIERHMARAHVSSMSEYIRMQALEGRVVVKEYRSLPPEVFDELKRIGVNLNQLARKFNSTDQMPPQLASLAETFDRFIAQELAHDFKNGQE